MAARVGTAKIEVGGFARDRDRRADVPTVETSLRRCAWKHSSLSPRKSCAVPSRKMPFGAGKMRLERKPRVVDSILAADQVLRYQRPVGPGQHVIVQRVHLAEGRAHLADLQMQSGGQGGERKIAFFQIHAVFAEADEEVGARIRIDHFLKADFALMHFERRGSVFAP